MTKEKWNQLNNVEEEYVGKHAPKTYMVWRVLGPAGPQETIYVQGLDNAKQAILGCWDWEITSETGQPIRV